MEDYFIPDYEPLLVNNNEFDLKNPIKNYPNDLGELFSIQAGIMKNELVSAGSVWELNKEIRIRVVREVNPSWYRIFRNNYGYERKVIITCNRGGNEYKRKHLERMKNKKNGTLQYYRTSHVNKEPTLRSLERIINFEDFGIPHPKRFRKVPYDYEMRQIIFDRLTFEGYCNENCCEILPQLIVCYNEYKINDDLPF